MATSVAELIVSFGSSGVAALKGDINSVSGSVDQAKSQAKLMGLGLAGLGAGLLQMRWFGYKV